MLPSVKKVNLSQQLTEAMIGLVENNSWVEGMKLPNEIELAESFHVSRNIMREALKVLISMNILDSHTGKGTFVKNGAKDSIFRMRFFEDLTRDSSVEHSLECRIVVEPELAALACKRCTDDDIAELRECVESCISESVAKKDFGFHVRLAELSGNPLLSNFLKSIICSLKNGVYSSFSEKATDIDISSLDDHMKIVEAMEMRDSELVKYLMYCHLKKRVDVIKSNIRP